MDVVAAAFFWAVSGSSGKYLFHQGLTPFQVVQLRVTLAALFLFLFLAVFRRDLLPIRGRDLPYFVGLGIGGMAMVSFTYFFTISRIQVAAAILLQYLAPAIIAVYAVVFWHERLTRPTITALVGSTLGCYFAVGAYNLEFLTLNWLGLVSGIGSGIAYAWYAVQAEKGMRRYHPWTVLFYALLLAALFWNLALPPFQAFGGNYDPLEWFWILYIALLGTVVPYGLYTQGINLIRSTRAGITATLEPILAAVVSYFFLGEVPAPLQVMGGAMVIGSIILLQLRQESDERSPDRIRSRGPFPNP
ncbi:MAG TPA: DMT family transporter [Syntrophobacteraceae bacterium]|nr:DMT family transporter [Syntrophobacteraceae bacterium]